MGSIGENETLQHNADVLKQQEELRKATIEEQKRKDTADIAARASEGALNRQAREDADKRHAELMFSIQSGKQPDKADLSYLAGEISGGRMSPIDLRTYLPAGLAGGKARTDALRMASEQYMAEHPGEQMDPSRLQRDYQNFKLPKTTQALTAVETFLPNIDRLESAIKDLPAGAPLKSMNALLQTGEVQIGNTAATNVKMLKGLLSHELGSSLGGGAALSDERIRMALDALGTDSPREAALNALGLLRQVEVNRHVNVALSGGVYGENYLRGIYGEDTANQLIANEREARKKTGKAALVGESGGVPFAGGATSFDDLWKKHGGK
jgi:hypothetical protein